MDLEKKDRDRKKNLNVTLCYPKPNEYNVQTIKTNLSESGTTMLV